MAPPGNRVAGHPQAGDHEPMGGAPPRDRRRPRSNSAGSNDGEQGDEGPNKRLRPIVLSPKKKATDAYGTSSRRITRTVDMNWEPTTVINAGISLLALDSEEAMALEMATASTKKKFLYDIFMTLSDIIPGLQESTDWASVRHRLEHHKSAAKTEDNRTFKVLSPKWLIWEPPLSRESKLGRGLNHPQCAQLLCPIEVKWEDKAYVIAPARDRFLIELKPPMKASNWPALLYKNYKADTNNLAKGFMRSDILVRAGRAVLFPPSVASAKDDPDAPDHQSNRRSKADIYEMTGVTPGFLAYVAVGVRYALSSETTFNQRGGVFNYQRFYNDLVTYLNDPVCKKDTDELMEWWNQRLFPAKETDEDEEESSILERLRSQARAQAMRLQEDGDDLD